MAPNDLYLLVFTSSCSAPTSTHTHTLCQGWLMWPVEYDRSKGVSPLRLGTLWLPYWFSLSSLSLGEASCCDLGTLSQPVERPRWQGPEASEHQPVRNWVLPTTIWVNLEETLHPQSSIEVTAVPITHLQPHEGPWASNPEFLTPNNCVR